MAFFKNPEEMFSSRAEKSKKSADEHWAKAKNGEGGEHYTYARNAYADAERNQAQSQKAKGKSW